MQDLGLDTDASVWITFAALAAFIVVGGLVSAWIARRRRLTGSRFARQSEAQRQKRADVENAERLAHDNHPPFGPRGL